MGELPETETLHARCLEILAETGLLVKNESILMRLREREVRCDLDRGLIFFTKSPSPLHLGGDIEVISAKSIWIPG